MPLNILTASSTETLVEHLVDSLARPGDPARKRPVLLPSRPLIERVLRRMARKQGVAMGVDFLLPGAFMEEVALGLGMDPVHPSWGPQGLFWRVLGLLPVLAGKYPGRLGASCAKARSLAALASEVSDRFDQYLHFRPDLIHAWDEDKIFNQFIDDSQKKHLKDIFKDGLPYYVLEDEQWQKDLWRELCKQLKGHEHPVDRLETMEKLAKTSSLEVFNPALEILATGPLPFPILKTLRALGERVEVNLRYLLPANGYIGDIRSRWLQLTDEKTVDLDAEVNPLLAQMGRQSIEAFNGLMKLSDSGQAFDPIEEDEDGRDSLLARLQADIRGLRQPDATERPVGETLSGQNRPLRSLRVHRCHGEKREIEILRDELLRAFKELDNLKPEEILILAPDLDLYGPLAEASLEREKEPPIPLGLAERRVEQGNPPLKALLAMLDMARGRGALSELLALLDLDGIRDALGVEESEALARRLRASGITFGFNPEHRKSLGAGTDPVGTWSAGLDRLLSGLWMGQELKGLDDQSRPVLSVAGDLGSGRQALVRGLDWFEDLMVTLDSWREAAGAGEWADRIEAAVEKVLLNAESGKDVDACLDLSRQLRQAHEIHACKETLDASAVADWAAGRGGEDGRRVAYTGGRVTLGGLKPLRALPCRVLAVIGLSDTTFPRRATERAWDLLAALPMPGDRDPRKDDRQLFLDCILAAKDRVILTAPVRSPRSDETGPLSACVEELVRTALDTLGVVGKDRGHWDKVLVCDHPLQPFDARQFNPSDECERSFDQHSLAVSRRLAQARLEKPMATAILDIEKEQDSSVELEDIFHFFRDPASAWLRARGMTPPRGARDAAEEDDEPADSPGGLQSWRIENLAAEEALHPADPHILERLAADRLLPQGILGKVAGEGSLQSAKDLVAQLVQAGGGQLQSCLVSGELENGLTVRAVLDHCGGEGGPVVGLDIGKILKAKTGDCGAMVIFSAWIRACLSSLSGNEKQNLLAAGQSGKGKRVVLRLPVVEKEQASTSLLQLSNLAHEGKTTLLTFAPKTSLALARNALEPSPASPVNVALGEWEGDEYRKGEGDRPSSALAWRGQDPFGDGRIQAWSAVAETVFGPVLQWWSGVEEYNAQPGARS